MGWEGTKTIILGLDGATFDVLSPRMERGQMPNLAALLQDGAHGPLRSTTPPFSAQAWVSLATGKNPGRHGVVDFWERSPDHSRRSFVTSHQVQGETLWQIAGRHGLRVGLVNVPVTYPPQPVNGYLVSGFLTPRGKDDFVYPPSLRPEILAEVPDYDPDPFDPLGAGKEQILELEGWMAKHEQIARRLMAREPVELFFSVAQALDHLQHLFWNDIADVVPSAGRAVPSVEGCYRLADAIIGHRRQGLDGQTNLFLVSDHGFGPVGKWFHVNRFLLEQGLLVLVGSGGTLSRLGMTPQRFRSLVRRVDVLGLRRRVGRLARVTLGREMDRALAPAVDWSRTLAISGSPATEGVFVNLKGREPLGIVEPGDAFEQVRDRLVAGLLAVRDPDTGEAVVRGAYRREELYEGPFLDLLPDVVFDLGNGPYLASDAPVAGQVVEPLPGGFVQGRHRPLGIFVAAGPHIRQGVQLDGASIVDVAPTVLYGMGLPVPEDMDGRPLLEIFTCEYRAANPVRTAPPVASDGVESRPGYDAEEAEEMERRLRGLGYVS